VTRLVVYSSQPERVKALLGFLHRAGGFEVSTQYTALGLDSEMKRHPSAVALVEMGPGLSFDTLNEIRRGSNFKVVLWAGAVSTELAFRAMGMGIRGILRHSLPATLQVKCLREVSEGALWYEKTFLESLVSTGMAERTAREARLVDVLAEGLRIKGFSGQMMPTSGIKACVSRLLQRAGVMRVAPEPALAMAPWADLMNPECRGVYDSDNS
jgi:DNA-binding NarL/FixJ family response regulator